MPPNVLLHYYSICKFSKYVNEKKSIFYNFLINKKTAHKFEQFHNLIFILHILSVKTSLYTC